MATFKDMVVKLPTIRSNPRENMYSGVNLGVTEANNYKGINGLGRDFVEVQDVGV